MGWLVIVMSKALFENMNFLGTLFLIIGSVCPVFADTTPEISVEYLNSLTGPKVTWENATSTDSDVIFINGKYYKYTYHKPENYTEANLYHFVDINEISNQGL